jgi:hypothetical protein
MPIKSALHSSTGRFQGSVQLVQAVANALEPQVGTASTTRCCWCMDPVPPSTARSQQLTHTGTRRFEVIDRALH